MKLYGNFNSSAAFRVRIALGLKGIAYESAFVNLLGGEQARPEFLKLNPQGLVPALVDDGAVLTQSLAIIDYLDETHPEPPFLPRTPVERARVRALALVIACEIHPLNNLRVRKYLKDRLGLDKATGEAWYRHWVAVGLKGFEAMLAADAGTGRFCHGDAPGLADICLVPQIFNARRFDCPLGDYPITMRIFDACMALPAFATAQPAKQPDAV